MRQFEVWVKGLLQDDFALEDRGPLPFAGPVVVWHPLKDAWKAPGFDFLGMPRLIVARAANEVLAYGFVAIEGAADEVDTDRWIELGDASTDTDRFFLFPSSQTESIIRWFNDDLEGFEELGGEQEAQLVEREASTSMLVVMSPDGNARLVGAHNVQGQLVFAALVIS